MALFHFQHVFQSRIGRNWNFDLVRLINRIGFKVDIVGQRYVYPLDRHRRTSGHNQTETQSNNAKVSRSDVRFE